VSEGDGRILALDLGEARIGVAVSDPTRTIAQALKWLPARPRSKLVQSLEKLVQVYRPSAIVVGLAVRENGSLGPEAIAQQRQAESLREHLGIPILLHDERYTSRMAHRVQKELGIRGRRAKASVHSLAAVHLLNDFLRRDPSVPPRPSESAAGAGEPS
jgi:putative Holliday junction resolvase